MKIRTFGWILASTFLLTGSWSLRAQQEDPTAKEKTEDASAAGSGAAVESEAVDVPESAEGTTDDTEVQTAIEEAEPPMEATQDEAEAAGVAPESETEPPADGAEAETSPAPSEDAAIDAETLAEDAAVIVGEDGIAVEAEGTDLLPEPADESLAPPTDDQEGLPTAEGSDLPNPDDLLPEDVYTPGVADVAPPPPTVRENKFEQERRLSVLYQEVKLQALKDEAIRQMREQADVARTDEDKRQALREYYKMLFARMVSIAPELEDKCRAMENAYMRRVSQFRVMPTIPLNPPPTPEPLPGRAESAPPDGADSEEG